MKPLRPYSSGGSMPMMARNVALRWISSPIASSRGESPGTPGRRLNAAMTIPTVIRMRGRAESMVSFLSDAHTGSTTPLVHGKGCEIHIECLEINRHVRHRLASVQHGKCTDSLCPTNDFIDVSYSTRHIGLVSKGHNFDRLIELERIKINAA